jgi:triosephosphate isomerase (TIM)
MSKSQYVIGNWKMNQSKSEIQSFFQNLESVNTENSLAKFGIAPQAIHLGLCLKLGAEKNVLIGAQNCATENSGAFTGEISPAALKDYGVDFVILGHSERRAIFNETNEIVNKKVHAALKNDLYAVVCIGETLEQRKDNSWKSVLTSQVIESTANVEKSDWKHILLAYEPVWAIGTGETATPAMANEAHELIISILKDQLSEEVAMSVPILYGGSVKPANFGELLNCPCIDGGLVGGASLKNEDYGALCQIASK